jgi:hypothetical protein
VLPVSTGSDCITVRRRGSVGGGTAAELSVSGEIADAGDCVVSRRRGSWDTGWSIGRGRGSDSGRVGAGRNFGGRLYRCGLSLGAGRMEVANAGIGRVLALVGLAGGGIGSVFALVTPTDCIEVA